MKITRRQLRQIIKEELVKAVQPAIAHVTADEPMSPDDFDHDAPFVAVYGDGGDFGMWAFDTFGVDEVRKRVHPSISPDEVEDIVSLPLPREWFDQYANIDDYIDYDDDDYNGNEW